MSEKLKNILNLATGRSIIGAIIKHQTNQATINSIKYCNSCDPKFLYYCKTLHSSCTLYLKQDLWDYVHTVALPFLSDSQRALLGAPISLKELNIL